MVSRHMFSPSRPSSLFFFFNDTATTEIYTLSLHDALPICLGRSYRVRARSGIRAGCGLRLHARRVDCALQFQVGRDRKSTRLNSSHSQISYAVFCLKKKNSNKKLILPLTFSSCAQCVVCPT